LSNPELRKQPYYVVQTRSAIQHLNLPPQNEITLMFLGQFASNSDKWGQLGTFATLPAANLCFISEKQPKSRSKDCKKFLNTKNNASQQPQFN
jgi:hypothetical protein